jgi:hypothetical protein
MLVIEARKEHFQKPTARAGRRDKASAKPSGDYAEYTAARRLDQLQLRGAPARRRWRGCSAS